MTMPPDTAPSTRVRRPAAVLALALSLAAAPLAAQPVPTVGLQPASASASLTVDGRLEALRQSTLAAQIGGNVLSLAVKAGDRVKAGQAIARIDERDTAAGLASADAGVAQADAAARAARMHLDRTRELRAQGFVSQAALDLAQSQHDAAAAGLTQARAGRAQAALARGFAAVVAPFDAVVLATHVEAGDLAAPGRPLVTLYVPGQMRAVVDLPASMSALARAASRVEVQLPAVDGAAGSADRRWVAPSARTELPAADAVSQTVEWRLDLAPADSAGLRPGQAVAVRFADAPPRASDAAARPVIPRAAVLRRGELTAVYAVSEGRFVLRAVRLGAEQGSDGVEVLAGLRPGERIALDPVRAGLAGATPAAQ
jgi:RND family efflux transporter MFP subunit